MAKVVYVKTYSDYEISGKDFGTVRNEAMRRILFTPDNVHSISIVVLRDGTLGIFNEGRVPFDFTISREKKIIAVVKFDADASALKINSNYRLTQTQLENREINTNPDLIRSANLNINLVNINGIGRIDLKIGESGNAACVLSDKELLFIRMNGHHSVPRLQAFMDKLVPSAALNSPEVKNMVGRQFFREWCEIHGWGLN